MKIFKICISFRQIYVVFGRVKTFWCCLLILRFALRCGLWFGRFTWLFDVFTMFFFLELFSTCVQLFRSVF